MSIGASDARKGVVYTDSSLIELILDRVGYRNEVFAGKPRLYDPAVGPGGFWLAAARRVLDWSLQHQRPQSDILEHLLTCHVGSEIDPIACEAALSQFQALLHPLLSQGDVGLHRPLLFQADSLAFFHSAESLPTHLLSADEQFDFCVGNPPYIGEKGNKALFQKLLTHYPAWQPYYQGKMDYLYFFIHLGISKLKEGGRLGFITTRYWLTADGASRLRQEILKSCKILELIDLGHGSAFRQASGQQNLIVILEKCTEPEKRQQHCPKWVLASGADFIREYTHAPAAINEILDTTKHEGLTCQVFTSQTPQGSWEDFVSPGKPSAARPWHLHKSSTEEAVLAKIQQAGLPLAEIFEDQQGVISGADKVTVQNIQFLQPEVVEAWAIQPGDGIFCLSQAELQALNLPENALRYVKPFFKNSHIQPYGVFPPDPPSYLLYLTPELSLDAYPSLAAHLSKFKPILQRKRECQTGRIPWYSLHWSRQQRLLEAPSLVTPRRSRQNCFAVSPAGYYKNSDITLLVRRSGVTEDLRYFLALLNSKVLDFWMAHRGKPKGRIREYYATPLRGVPLKRLDLSKTSERRIHDEIVSTVQLIMDWTLIKRKKQAIQELQQGLDAQIATLYGLTFEEKALLNVGSGLVCP